MTGKFDFMKPFYYLYYILCMAIIWFLSFIDDVDMFGDDSIHHFCDIIKNENIESLRSVTIPVSFLLIFPFILHFLLTLRKKINVVSLVMTVFIFIFWFYLYFGRYIKCY